MVSAMNKFKDAAYRNYDAAEKVLAKSGAANAIVSTVEASNKLKKSLIELGLVTSDKTGRLIINANPSKDEAKRIIQVFDGKSINTLRKVFNQIQTHTGEMSFADSRKLLKGVDDILESSGFYNQGEAAISNNARKALIVLRNDLNEAAHEGLKLKNVLVKGSDGVEKQMNASEFWKAENGKYSQFREVYDHFALPSQLGGDVKQISATVDKMIGEKGFALEQNFAKLATVVGGEAESTLQRLQQLRAGRNLAPAYTEAKGLLATGKEIIFGGPRTFAQRAAKATIALEKVQPRQSFQRMVDMAIDESTRNTPATARDMVMVQAKANAVDMVKRLQPDEWVKMVTNPVVLRQFYNSVEGAGNRYDQMQEQLIQEAQKKVQ